MISIALIDDKSYGLEQLKEIHFGEDYNLSYFETFEAFANEQKNFDIVYLDYFLDKDGLTGLDVLDKVKTLANKVIGFSSVERYSKLLKVNGADEGIVKK